MKEVLDYFKCLVIDSHQESGFVNTSLIQYGIILDFVPTPDQGKLLSEFLKSNNFRTLFSKGEALNLSTDEKVIKQIMHYYAEFVLGEGQMIMNYMHNDKPITLTFVRGISTKQLSEKVEAILLANKPAKDVDDLLRIINFYKIDFDINDVENNELRVMLFDEKKHKFNNGDDVVRYIVYKTTNESLLIKSEAVLHAVKNNASNISLEFMRNNYFNLGECFNRHKKIIMSLKIGTKIKEIKTIINQVTRSSKVNHKPLYIAKSKTFIADSMKNGSVDKKVLSSMNVRDKFKILNLLRFKMNGMSSDIFVIRNGKVWEERSGRTVYPVAKLQNLEHEVLSSLVNDLSYLRNKTILIPDEVDYGLPVSRKQTLGHLPFGTSISVEGNISSGIYWKDEWGARDLDLSAIDMAGNRTGWGCYNSYEKREPLYSGDMTSADPDAMEFMTSSTKEYILCVNVFSGEVGCKAQVIVGKSNDNWIDQGIIREDIQLKSKGNIIGIVENNKYIAYQGRLNDRRANFGANNVQLQKALTFHWTTKKILDILGVNYGSSIEKPDYDLSLEGFTIDKLEEVFKI